MREAHARGDAVAFALLEVGVPLPVTHARVAHACRVAGLTRPRWSRAERAWTMRPIHDDTGDEAVRVVRGADGRTVRVLVEWTHHASPARIDGNPSGRAFVTALLTGMRWALDRRASGLARRGSSRLI